MFSSESKSQAERTVQSGNGLRQLTEREARETVGGCGGREYFLSTSDTGPGRPVAIVARNEALT